MDKTSRRTFLVSLGPLTVAPFICAKPELTRSGYKSAPGKTTDATLSARAATVNEVEMVTVKKVQCPPWPLRSLGAVPVHGQPTAAGKTIFESSDHQVTGGVWECSPGTFDLTFTWDEMALMLEGELIIKEASGHEVRVQPGDFFFIPRGAQTRWTVVKPLKKLFFSREQAST